MNRDKNPEIEITADGSATLYLNDLDEHYHSTKGAVAESLHVYVETGWRAAPAKNPVRVFEVGFGTGLNAALTAEAALNAKIPTIYHSVELYPLEPALSGKLGYERVSEFFPAVNNAEWNTEVRVNSFFTLIKRIDNFLTMEFPSQTDIVYFDAFAPEKQPEMWNEDIFRRLFAAMSPGGKLTTYCAKGIIRRRLQATGFIVERLPGPANGKREILRATKPQIQQITPDDKESCDNQAHLVP
ncbi:MAG: tRNA (5-methylaminomethyl-2-thiouridine)(34)-methyltransferase MnmD [Paramuribaculum sp.]|nr:tRNA (5-methylaminomethyl-2-thiouridine)(34)-methyltransferase MnmD [Paramuribaculum sp.]MDE6324211.1 tRNA (5-methylaminomethyl-2-thiouridine)(34)-methyltransferase MnmD [Paramuribaculum sp.]